MAQTTLHSLPVICICCCLHLLHRLTLFPRPLCVPAIFAHTFLFVLALHFGSHTCIGWSPPSPRACGIVEWKTGRTGRKRTFVVGPYERNKAGAGGMVGACDLVWTGTQEHLPGLAHTRSSTPVHTSHIKCMHTHLLAFTFCRHALPSSQRRRQP